MHSPLKSRRQSPLSKANHHMSLNIPNQGNEAATPNHTSFAMLGDDAGTQYADTQLLLPKLSTKPTRSRWLDGLKGLAACVAMLIPYLVLKVVR